MIKNTLSPAINVHKININNKSVTIISVISTLFKRIIMTQIMSVMKLNKVITFIYERSIIYNMKQ